jgi:superfamily II DNA or RNA helicase
MNSQAIIKPVNQQAEGVHSAVISLSLLPAMTTVQSSVSYSFTTNNHPNTPAVNTKKRKTDDIEEAKESHTQTTASQSHAMNVEPGHLFASQSNKEKVIRIFQEAADFYKADEKYQQRLYWYQQRAMTELGSYYHKADATLGHLNAAFIFATGTGKTILINTIVLTTTVIIRKYNYQGRVVVLVPTANLRQQIAKEYKGFSGLRSPINDAFNDKNTQLVSLEEYSDFSKLDVITPITLTYQLHNSVLRYAEKGDARYQKAKASLDVAVCSVLDEAHTAMAHLEEHRDRSFPSADKMISTLLVTATPEYNLRGGARHYHDVYEFAGIVKEQNPITSFEAVEAIKAGANCPVQFVNIETSEHFQAKSTDDGKTWEKALNKPKINNIFAQIYFNGVDRETGFPNAGQQAIAHCSTIAHAKDFSNQFNVAMSVDKALEHPWIRRAYHRYMVNKIKKIIGEPSDTTDEINVLILKAFLSRGFVPDGVRKKLRSAGKFTGNLVNQIVSAGFLAEAMQEIEASYPVEFYVESETIAAKWLAEEVNQHKKKYPHAFQKAHEHFRIADYVVSESATKEDKADEMVLEEKQNLSVTSSKRRDPLEIIDDFKEGAILILANVNMLINGTNCPHASLHFGVSPTFSYPNEIQRTGRVMRKKLGKIATCYNLIAKPKQVRFYNLFDNESLLQNHCLGSDSGNLEQYRAARRRLVQIWDAAESFHLTTEVINYKLGYDASSDIVALADVLRYRRRIKAPQKMQSSAAPEYVDLLKGLSEISEKIKNLPELAKKIEEQLIEKGGLSLISSAKKQPKKPSEDSMVEEKAQTAVIEKPPIDLSKVILTRGKHAHIKSEINKIAKTIKPFVDILAHFKNSIKASGKDEMKIEENDEVIASERIEKSVNEKNKLNEVAVSDILFSYQHLKLLLGKIINSLSIVPQSMTTSSRSVVLGGEVELPDFNQVAEQLKEVQAELHIITTALVDNSISVEAKAKQIVEQIEASQVKEKTDAETKLDDAVKAYQKNNVFDRKSLFEKSNDPLGLLKSLIRAQPERVVQDRKLIYTLLEPLKNASECIKCLADFLIPRVVCVRDVYLTGALVSQHINWSLVDLKSFFAGLWEGYHNAWSGKFDAELSRHVLQAIEKGQLGIDDLYYRNVRNRIDHFIFVDFDTYFKKLGLNEHPESLAKLFNKISRLFYFSVYAKCMTHEYLLAFIQQLDDKSIAYQGVNEAALSSFLAYCLDAKECDFLKLLLKFHPNEKLLVCLNKHKNSLVKHCTPKSISSYAENFYYTLGDRWIIDTFIPFLRSCISDRASARLVDVNIALLHANSYLSADYIYHLGANTTTNHFSNLPIGTRKLLITNHTPVNVISAIPGYLAIILGVGTTAQQASQLCHILNIEISQETPIDAIKAIASPRLVSSILVGTGVSIAQAMSIPAHVPTILFGRDTPIDVIKYFATHERGRHIRLLDVSEAQQEAYSIARASVCASLAPQVASNPYALFSSSSSSAMSDSSSNMNAATQRSLSPISFLSPQARENISQVVKQFSFNESSSSSVSVMSSLIGSSSAAASATESSSSVSPGHYFLGSPQQDHVISQMDEEVSQASINEFSSSSSSWFSSSSQSVAEQDDEYNFESLSKLFK